MGDSAKNKTIRFDETTLVLARYYIKIYIIILKFYASPNS